MMSSTGKILAAERKRRDIDIKEVEKQYRKGVITPGQPCAVGEVRQKVAKEG